MSKKPDPSPPTGVQIGPYRYSVRVVKDLATVEKTSFLYGHHSSQRQEISLDARNTRDRNAVTLLHEALHGMGEQLPADLTEEQVTHLAPLLVRFLRDNPSLVSFVTEREKD